MVLGWAARGKPFQGGQEGVWWFGVGNWESGLQGCVTRGTVGCRNKGLTVDRSQSYHGWPLASALNDSQESDSRTMCRGVLQKGGSVWYHAFSCDVWTVIGARNSASVTSQTIMTASVTGSAINPVPLPGTLRPKVIVIENVRLTHMSEARAPLQSPDVKHS